LAFLDTLKAGDGVAVFQAKQQVIPVLPRLTSDLAEAREAVTRLPAPRGGCDWPGAVEEAHKIFATHTRGGPREIILLTDGQKHGWADGPTLRRWEILGKNLGSPQAPGRPRVWVVNVAPKRPAAPPNYSLAPLASTRAVAW